MHEPLQFDLVEVSRTNQYKAWPLALVSTVALPIFMDPRVFPEDAAGADAAPELPPEPPELPEPDDELPHAAITSTAATAPAGTSHLFRMTCLRSNEISLTLIARSGGLVRSQMVHMCRPSRLARGSTRVNSSPAAAVRAGCAGWRPPARPACWPPPGGARRRAAAPASATMPPPRSSLPVPG